MINPVECFRKKGAGFRAVVLALAWLVCISVLHTWREGNTGTGDRAASMLRVGFLPITCHLLCPVTHARLMGTEMEFSTIKFSSWPDMIDAVRGQEIDIAFILAPIAIALREQGVPVKIVLLGHRDGTALVAGKETGITKISELQGKTVGIPIRFSTQNLELLKLCKEHGVAPDSMEILEIPPPDMPSALGSGGIDAYIVGEPYAAQAELAHTGRILAQMRDVAPGFISSVVIVNQEIMRKHGKRVKKLIREFYKSASWIEAHRRLAADRGADAYGLPKELIEYVLTSSKDRVSYRNLIPKPREIQKICNSMVEFGLLPHAPSGKEMIDLSWR